MAAHPRYANPKIAEALCEVHFRMPPEAPWKPSIPGALFKALEDFYPEVEPITEQGVQLTFGPEGGPVQQLLPPRTRFKMKHRERPFLVQIKESVFTFNVLPPYPGWDEVLNEFKAAWQCALKIMVPAAISRVGMRYINRIPLRSADEVPGYWLKPSDYFPAVVLRSQRGCVSRVEARLGKEDRVVVTVAHTKPRNGEEYGSLVFDIDRIIESDRSPEWSSLKELTERLHDSIWEIFESGKGPNLDDLLKGKP